MTLFPAWVDPSLVDRIGWTLVHSLWQGAVVLVVHSLLLWALRGARAQTRYLVSCASLLLVVTAAVVTFSNARPHTPATLRTASMIGDAQAVAASAAAAQRQSASRTEPMAPISNTNGDISSAWAASAATDASAVRIINAPRPYRAAAALVRAWRSGLSTIEQQLHVLVLIWVVGLGASSIRLCCGLTFVWRLKRRDLFEAPVQSQRRLTAIARRMGVQTRIRLFSSRRMRTAAVIGWLRPVILVPMGALAGLTPEQMDAVLAHEIAHIRRHDYLVNLLQSVVETLFFYQPAVWVISRRIRVEREHCCDDEAVAVVGDAFTYANALTELEQLRQRVPAFAMAASGGSLVQRIRRLLTPALETPPTWSAATASVVLGVLFVGLALASTSIAGHRPPEPAEAMRALASAAARGTDLSARAIQEVLAAPAAAVTPAVVDPRPANAPPASDTEMPVFSFARVEPSAGAAVDVLTAGASIAPAPSPPAAAAATTTATTTGLTRIAQASPEATVLPAAPADVAPPRPTQDDRRMRAQNRTTGYTDEDKFRFHWTDGGSRFIARGRGEIQITDDDMGVASISKDGHLIVEEQRDAKRTVLEIRATREGTLERTWTVDGARASFEPDGRAYLTRTLPEVVRRTGIAADARVRRILAGQGPDAVLAEVTRIKSDWVKRQYLTVLLDAGTVDETLLTRILTQIGKELTTEDFDRAEMLVRLAKQGRLTTDAQRQAYAAATLTIDSDFEHRRALGPLVSSGRLSEDVLVAVLQSAARIDSDFEAASLLTTIGQQQMLTDKVVDAYVAAARTVDSDYELRRALVALVSRAGAPPAAMTAALTAATTIDSDVELVGLLQAIIRQQPIDEAIRRPFFAAVDTLTSNSERARVLRAVVSRGSLSDQTALAVAESTTKMSSSQDAATVLRQLFDTRPPTTALRAAYLDAAERLSSASERDRLREMLTRQEGAAR
jgi:beta-lactamase regulating signal transducer with metallopeptidase domain